MARKIPRPGEHYRSIYGNEVEIVLIANNLDTHRKMVVYKDVDDSSVYYTKSVKSFLAKADEENGLDSEQEYQFVNITDIEKKEETEESLQDMIITFLEMKSSRDKMLYLQKKHLQISDEFLTAISIGIDFVETKTDLEDRYRDILNYLNTLMRYETRL